MEIGIEFKKYCSIDEKGKAKTINNYMARGYDNEDWVVTTKIHGANFSILITKDGMKFSKRTTWLKEDENFFNYQRAIDKHKDKIEKVREIVLRDLKLSEDTNVQLFGELFGGKYPHPNVNAIKEVKNVQNKVWYCPDIDFYPFDIYVRDGKSNYPIDHDIFESIVKEAGFGLFAEALFIGTLKECLDYPNDYLDPTYKYYDLPSLEDNICEGNVLKPLKAKCERSGSRVILKSKNEKFREKKIVRKNKKVKDVPLEVQIVVSKGEEYITENRLRNVLSHLGEITKDDLGKIMKEFSQDIRNEMISDNPNIFSNLEPNESKIAWKAIYSSASLLVRENLINIF